MFESAELCQTSMLILEQLNVITRNVQQVSDALNRENDYKIDTIMILIYRNNQTLRLII